MKPIRICSLERPIRELEGNIKIEIRETGYVGRWIQLIQDRILRRVWNFGSLVFGYLMSTQA